MLEFLGRHRKPGRVRKKLKAEEGRGRAWFGFAFKSSLEQGVRLP